MTSAPKPIRIALVDDHPILRQGIAALISDQPDLQLVGQASNGLEAIEQFRLHRPDVMLMDLQMPGMNGIDAMSTIRSVHAGNKRIPPEIAAELADHAADDQLTPREIEVLRLVAAGNANKIVADRLSITEETVKAHVKNILSKLDANDRPHAVTIGLKRGIIEL